MKNMIFPLLFCVFIACKSDPTIALPEAKPLPISTIDNAYPIQLFYDETKVDSIHISNANNASKAKQALYIDKRLALKHIIPHIKNFRKTANDTVAVKQYIAVRNTTTKQPSFIELSEIIYSANDQFSKFYIKEFPEAHMQYLTLSVNFKANGKITVDGNDVDTSELLVFLKEYIDFVAEGKQTLIYLNFNETLHFQYYIKNYNRILNLSTQNIKIAPKQFIYNESLLPDCNCVL